MLTRGGELNEPRLRAYPIADWTNAQVFSYLQFQQIPLPPEYRRLGHSFGDTEAGDLLFVRDHFPDDYAKILAVFPFAESVVKRYEFFASDPPHEISEV
jgi:phosphoadenosine phosphosulfate reductase